VNAAVALDPVSLSFGAVPSGSGQSKTGTIALSFSLGTYWRLANARDPPGNPEVRDAG
jgi:hypothetical protein